MALNGEMGLKKLRKDGLSSNIKEYYTSYKYKLAHLANLMNERSKSSVLLKIYFSESQEECGS